MLKQKISWNCNANDEAIDSRIMFIVTINDKLFLSIESSILIGDKFSFQ